LTVAKLGEAEVMPGDDILIAHAVPPAKSHRLRELARNRRVTVAVDSVEFARGAGNIGTVVEIDVGAHRCGVGTPDDAVAVARACEYFRGVLYWPSWLDDAGFHAAASRIQETCAALRTGGFQPTIVSGGSTPGAARTALIPQTTEIRPGAYVFYDATCLANGLCTESDCALRALVTIVSTAVPGQCVIDAGSKTFSSDPTRGVGSYCRFVGRPWTIQKLYEEHGCVMLGESATPCVGEKHWVIPSHVCPAVNLHDELWYGRAGRVEGSWRILARGRTR